VNANLILKWLRDPRFNPAPEPEPVPSFLPIDVVAEPPVLGPPVIDAAVVDAPVHETGVLGLRIEIVSPSGHRISVSGAYDPDALCRLVRG